MRSLAIATAAVAACVFAPVAAANTITVNTTDDVITGSGCSLRAAVVAANDNVATAGCPAGSGADTVSVPAGTYKFTRAGIFENAAKTGDLDISSALTIRGAGSGATVVDAQSLDRVIGIQGGGTVDLEAITLTGGHAPNGDKGPDFNGNPDTAGGNGTTGFDGGGILIDASQTTVTLTDVIVRNNVAGSGGSGGTGFGKDSTASSNDGNGGDGTGGNGGPPGFGGGIANHAKLVLVRSHVTDNAAGNGGNGGIGFAGKANFRAGNHNYGGDGGDGRGGDGGPGGTGGGIYSDTSVIVRSSVIASNKAGTGGNGGLSKGQDGRDATFQGEGGDGGESFAGSAGDGGRGGGLALNLAAGATNEITDTAISSNRAGTGGLAFSSTKAGTNNGGKGGNGAGDPGNGTGPYSAGVNGPGAGGSGGDGGSGGGVYVLGGALTVSRSLLTGNRAGNGTNGQTGQSGDFGEGGRVGVAVGVGFGGSGGKGGSGGGLAGVGPGATIADTTVDGNTAGSAGSGARGVTPDGSAEDPGSGGDAGVGGGLDGSGAKLTVTRATITTNALGTAGTTPEIANGSHNGAAPTGGALRGGGSTLLTASIVSDNAAPRCSGAIADGGSNIDFPADAGCPGTVADPFLGDLVDNGGPTLTRAIAPFSPALDSNTCSSSDQRGVARPTGARCDSGAYELALPVIADQGAVPAGTFAALHATVTPNGGTTSVAFEYGTSASYGTTTGAQSIAGGTTPRTVGGAITGLAPGTTYHWRTRATNEAGTALGPDQSFKTPGVAPAGGIKVVGAPQVAGDGSFLVMIVQVPSAGTLDASATAKVATKGKIAFKGKSTKTLKIGSFRAKPKKAGRVKIKLKFTRAARKILKKRSLKAAVKIKFTPKGKTKATTKTVTVKLPKTKKKRR
jgi:hypothetical protein